MIIEVNHYRYNTSQYRTIVSIREDENHTLKCEIDSIENETNWTIFGIGDFRVTYKKLDQAIEHLEELGVL